MTILEERVMNNTGLFMKNLDENIYGNESLPNDSTALDYGIYSSEIEKFRRSLESPVFDIVKNME